MHRISCHVVFENSFISGTKKLCPLKQNDEERFLSIKMTMPGMIRDRAPDGTNLTQLSSLNTMVFALSEVCWVFAALDKP